MHQLLFSGVLACPALPYRFLDVDGGGACGVRQFAQTRKKRFGTWPKLNRRLPKGPRKFLRAMWGELRPFVLAWLRVFPFQKRLRFSGYACNQRSLSQSLVSCRTADTDFPARRAGCTVWHAAWRTLIMRLEHRGSRFSSARRGDRCPHLKNFFCGADNFCSS